MNPHLVVIFLSTFLVVKSSAASTQSADCPALVCQAIERPFEGHVREEKRGKLKILRFCKVLGLPKVIPFWLMVEAHPHCTDQNVP